MDAEADNDDITPAKPDTATAKPDAGTAATEANDDADSSSEDEGEGEGDSGKAWEAIEDPRQGPGITSGTTANVVLLSKDSVLTANAGDCRTVLSRAGVAVDLSVDHKPEDDIELT